MASKGQKFRKHPVEFKVNVVKEYLDDPALSLAALARKYDLNTGLLWQWVNQYKTTGIPIVRQSGRPRKDGKPINTSSSETISIHDEEE